MLREYSQCISKSLSLCYATDRVFLMKIEIQMIYTLNSMDVIVIDNWTFKDVSPHIFITWNSVNATLKLRACIQTWKIYSCIFDLVHYFLTSITKEFGRNFIIVTLSNVQIAPAKHRFKIKLSHPIFLMLYSILMYVCAISIIIGLLHILSRLKFIHKHGLLHRKYLPSNLRLIIYPTMNY